MQRKEYYVTASEAAEILGITERGVRKNAINGKYGDIDYIDGVRGGTSGRMMQIKVNGLPSEAQSEYFRRHELIDEPERMDVTDYDTAGEDARRTANERYKILKEYEAYIAVPGKRTELTKRFVSEWNAGHPENTLAVSTLYDWRKKNKKSGLSGLLPNYGKRRNQRVIDEAAWKYFQQQYLRESRPSVQFCYDILVLEAKKNDWTIPSVVTVARMAKNDIPEAVIRLLRFGQKDYYDNIQAFTRRDPDSIQAGEVFVGDHHVLDLFINTGTAEKPVWVRPWMTAWLDMRSRKFVGWTVNLKPCTDEIIAAFAKAALDTSIGLPRHIYIDNGRDYCSAKFAGRGNRGKRMTLEDRQQLFDEGKRTATLMERLQIQTHWAIVENARAKVIERAFKDVVERFSKAFPTYCGRCQDERPDSLEGKLKNPRKYGMNLKEFTAVFDDWIRNVFNKTCSQGKGRQGESPDQTYMRTRMPVRLADPDVLRLFFMKSTNPFKIGRNGVTFHGEEYYNPDMVLHKGTSVFIRYRDDEPDTVWLYNLRDEYIGEAHRIQPIPAIEADADIIAAEQIRKAKERKIVQSHPSYQAAKEAGPATAVDITELYRIYGNAAPDVTASATVEMITMPSAGREAVRSMQATGTDDINPFAAMAKAKIQKRRNYDD